MTVPSGRNRDRSLRRYHRRLNFDSEVFGVSIAKPKRPGNEDAFVFLRRCVPVAPRRR